MNAIAFYSLFFSSAVLVYGIGLNRVGVIEFTVKDYFVSMMKNLLTVCSVCSIVYLLSNLLLVTYGMLEFMPVFVVMVFFIVSLFFEFAFRTMFKTFTSEFAVSILCIIVGLSEGISLLESVFFGALSLLSVYFMIPLVVTIKGKLTFSERKSPFAKCAPFFASVAVLMILLLVWNVSWFNSEVFK